MEVIAPRIQRLFEYVLCHDQIFPIDNKMKCVFNAPHAMNELFFSVDEALSQEYEGQAYT